MRINRKQRLLTSITRRKMAFVGHVMKKQNFETDLLIGAVYGKRGRGRLKTRYSDNIKKREWKKTCRNLQDGTRQEAMESHNGSI